MNNKREPDVEKYLRKEGLEMKDLNEKIDNNNRTDDEILRDLLSYYVAIDAGISRAPPVDLISIFLK
jgi:hypothetical protein